MSPSRAAKFKFFTDLPYKFESVKLDFLKLGIDIKRAPLEPPDYDSESDVSNKAMHGRYFKR